MISCQVLLGDKDKWEPVSTFYLEDKNANIQLKHESLNTKLKISTLFHGQKKEKKKKKTTTTQENW